MYNRLAIICHILTQMDSDLAIIAIIIISIIHLHYILHRIIAQKDNHSNPQNPTDRQNLRGFKADAKAELTSQISEFRQSLPSFLSGISGTAFIPENAYRVHRRLQRHIEPLLADLLRLVESRLDSLNLSYENSLFDIMYFAAQPNDGRGTS